jgi:LysR family transcriptional activator of nhaA
VTGVQTCALPISPLLLPSRADPLRAVIDAWFESHGLRPDIVGEFGDSALLKTFGRTGLGLFPAPIGMEDDLHDQYGARRVGLLDGVRESWYAISLQRRVQHPGVALVQSGSSERLGLASARSS